LVVRLLTNDDQTQARRAAALFASEQIFISKTVLLESEWVLRFSYELPPKVILQALRNIVGLPNVMVEQQREIAEALDGFEQGLDFADALHLASSRRAGRFATFDKKLIKRAEKLMDVELVLA
ncbi:MAG TPA: type II toxin-antitoxin system VapC family toxin, partial [Gallionella sp.]|nr:type II toxin-antitoxin system VapC family toxin [Gallionella sp.]